MLNTIFVQQLQDLAENVEKNDNRFTVEFCGEERRKYPDFTVVLNNTSNTDQSFVLQHPGEIPGEIHPPIYLHVYNDGYIESIRSYDSVDEAMALITNEVNGVDNKWSDREH